ncbi:MULTISPECIES: amino acid ABC transporter substrate-binding protein [Oceanimonas]|uniref:Amino acid ABC transporter substrate-binding protein n=1 Tax=Oceanimonas doudoroffii TaxID=84158 RepID=A0A233RJN9_9GAMM|nr:MULTISPECIES: amino acid ABC transporter substrate-binding protein [Oceanimonas]NHH99808.1 putative amino-acid ABC transporter-binding protein YhdW [Oceanimonas sp. MB9]OXY83599.1 amino acid ABC transporter substrate-binding protein [Oceanimonas doudoroffii]
MTGKGKAALLVAASLMAGTLQAATLDEVKQRGVLKCGVNSGLPGFSNPDDKGVWKGLDVDLCRGIAAAVFNDDGKVQYIPLNAKERLTALQSGEIDVLSRNTTWTSSRDTELGVNFAGINYYDGQGFLINKSLGVSSAKELDGAAICIQSGTTTELNVADYFRRNGIGYSAVVFDTSEQTVQGLEAGRCDVLTSDLSQLYALRIKLSKPDEAVALPEVISKEPLGPSVRQGDDQWFNIVKWTHFAMVNAEELGLTKDNVDGMKSSENPDVRRLLGLEADFGKGMGLDKDWAYRIIKLVGNYGEIFDANVGQDSPLKIERGLNALWTEGGLQYAPPVR